MKRGVFDSRTAQVTIFIIIAVILIGAVAITLFLTKPINLDNQFSSNPDVNARFNQLRANIFDCMKFTSQDSLDLIGIQGGYYKQPKEFFDLGWAIIPYYYKDKKLLMPTNLEIQKQLGLAVDDNIRYCLEGINSSYFNISYFDSTTVVQIKKEEVLFNIDMPVSIQRDAKTVRYELRDYPVSVNSKLSDMLDVARYVTDSHKEDPNNICISCLGDMGKERNLYSDMLDFGDGSSTLVVVSTNQSEMSPLIFEFLNKYK